MLPPAAETLDTAEIGIVLDTQLEVASSPLPHPQPL